MGIFASYSDEGFERATTDEVSCFNAGNMDLEGRQRLFLSYFPLMAFIFRSYGGFEYDDFEDDYQEALAFAWKNMCRNYDPAEGSSLGTYLSTSIKFSLMGRKRRREDILLNREVMAKLRREYNKLTVERDGVSPLASEVAEAAGVDLNIVILFMHRDKKSLSDSLSGSDGLVLEDRLHEPPNDRRGALSELNQVLQVASERIHWYPEESREYRILTEVTFCFGPKRKTLSYLAQEFGITRERARQIERKALGEVEYYASVVLGRECDFSVFKGKKFDREGI